MSIKKKSKFKISKPKIICFAVIVVLSLISLCFSRQLESVFGLNDPFYEDIKEEDFVIHFVDVGQGDCTIIEWPNDEIMIIDAGEGSEKSKLEKYLNTVVFAGREKKIDYLIATHSDSDHIGNIPYLLEKYEVKNIYRPNIYSKSETVPEGNVLVETAIYDKFISGAKREPGCNLITIEDGLPIIIKNKQGQSIGDVSIWGPLQTNYDDVNDFCPFIVLDCNGSKTLITGDASSEVENEILSLYSDIIPSDIDIYHCGHHGSNTSTSEALLDQTNPEYAIISCEKNNSYGHPHAETLSKLNERQISIYNTATDGNIIFAYSNEFEKSIATGSLDVSDQIRWWMVVLSIDVISFVLIFSIRIKVRKKL